VRVGQKVRHVLIGAVLLTQDIGRAAIAIGEPRARDRAVELIVDDVIVDPGRRAETRAVDRGQGCLLGSGPGFGAPLAGGGVVGQAGTERRTFAGIEAKAGRLFGAVGKPVVEDPVE